MLFRYGSMEVYDRGTYKDVRYPEWRQNGGHVKVDGGVNNRAPNTGSRKVDSCCRPWKTVLFPRGR